MSEENKALARRAWEAVGNPDLVDEVYAPDVVWHEPDGEVIRGTEGAKQFISTYKTAFPDLNITVEDVIAEGDKVVTRVTLRGTHQGETEQTSEGEVDVGTTFRNTSKFLGRQIESTYQVTENDPPHKQCVRITSGPLPGSGCYLYEPSDGGSTRFTQIFETEVGGFFKLAEPLVARVVRRQMETDMATLKDLLEAGEAEDR